MSKTRFAIVGMGSGGHAFAAHLSLLGHAVTAWDVDRGRVDAIRDRGTIAVDGAVVGEGTPELVTSDLREAIDGADVVMITVPAIHQREAAQRLSESVKGDQTLVVHAGATGGALETKHVLQRAGAADVAVAEARTLLYQCRSIAPGQVMISRIKKRVEVASLPAERASDICALLSEPLPNFEPAANVLVTSLGNISAMMHPLPTLVNASRCENGDTFRYYYDGISPRVGALIEQLDAERLAIAAALSISVPSVLQWYMDTYPGTGTTLHERVNSNPGYADIGGPTGLATRYITEDVPTGLVPMAEVAHAIGVRTPLMDSIINLASGLLGRDFRDQGRSLARLGLQGLSAAEIESFVGLSPATSR